MLSWLRRRSEIFSRQPLRGHVLGETFDFAGKAVVKQTKAPRVRGPLGTLVPGPRRLNQG